MLLTASIKRILSEAEKSIAKPMSPESQVWMVEGGGKSSKLLRAHLTNAFFQSGADLTIYHEDPADYGLGGECHSLGGSAWALGSTFDPISRDAVQWLGLGNWLLCAGGVHPISGSTDLIRRSPDEIMDFLRTHLIRAVIDSFHDDDPWIVATEGA